MKQFILILIALNLNASLEAQNRLSGTIDNDDLGAWAYKTHNLLCAKIYHGLENGRLSAVQVEDKTLSQDAVLLLFQEAYVAFISTNSDDPTLGYDTTVYAPLTENYYLFIKRNAGFAVQVHKKGPLIKFNSKQIESLLSEEELLYLKLFALKDSVQLRLIPAISTLLMKDMNIRLHLEGKMPKSNLYRTDSCSHKYNEQEKNSRGCEEVITYVSTDQNDPTIGYDSIAYIPLVIALNDTSLYQFMYFSFSGQADKMSLFALSTGFSVPVYHMQVTLPYPYGFMKYKEIKYLNPQEKKMLEFAILLHIQNALNYYGGDYEIYMDYFELESKNERRYRLRR